MPKPTASSIPLNPYTSRVQYRIPVPKGMPKAKAVNDVMQTVADSIDQAIVDIEKVDSSGEDMPKGDANIMYFQPEGKRRKKEPPVYNKRRGDKATALAIASDPQLRLQAMEAYEKDMRS